MEAAKERELWKTYRGSQDAAAREELLKRHVPLVRFTLERMTLPQNRAWLDADDLVSAGFIGLADAVEKFNPDLGGKFSTYACFRIRGAILDEMRALDWVPRSVRQKSRELEQAYETLARKRHREASDAEVARHMKLSLKQFHALLGDVNVPPVVSLDELLEDKEKKRRDVIASERHPGDRQWGSAFALLAAKEAREVLARLIDGLPERERLVLTLYYYEELTLREIAAIMEVTESRVCQVHGQAIARLRGTLRAERMELAVS